MGFDMGKLNMSMRSTAAAIAFLCLTCGTARPQSPAERMKTAEYLAGFQNPDGGFGGGPG